MTTDLDRDVVFAEVVVVLWLTVVLVRTVRALARGDRRSILFVQLVFLVFFAAPLVLDLTIGPPQFTHHRGFILGQGDRTTNLIYLGYIAWVPLVFRVVGGPPRFETEAPRLQEVRGWLKVFAWTTMLALPFVITLAPAPEDYARYAAYVGDTAGANRGYQAVVTLAATLAVISGVIVLTAPNAVAPVRVAALPFLAIGVWIHGKRSIVAMALLLTLYMLWTRGVLRGRRFIAVSLASGLALGVFSYAYQAEVRQVDETPIGRTDAATASPVYVNYRVDYGRDAITRQTIYAELHPDELHVLDYRGQSLLFDLTFFVPRQMWPDKPYPYAVYATAAMFDIPVRDMGWGITTSWLDEAIANLGWLGLILGPLVPALVCRIGDRLRTPFGGLLTVTVGGLLLILQLIAFMPLFALWLAAVIRHRVVAAKRPTAALAPTGLGRPRG